MSRHEHIVVRPAAEEQAAASPRRAKTTVLLLAVAAVALAIAAGSLLGEQQRKPPIGEAPPNPVLALDAALAAGTPAYVLIRSTTCASCVEIAQTAQSVTPDYVGRIAFVDAISSNLESQEILERYPTPYVPTSVFIAADGETFDTHIGPLTDAQMRAKLDELLSAE